MKDKVYGGVIGTVGSIIAGLTMIWFSGIRTNAQANKKALDSKLDVIVFEKFVVENKKQHLELKKYSDDKLDMVLEYIESGFKGVDTRIEDLKYYWDKTHKDGS